MQTPRSSHSSHSSYSPCAAPPHGQTPRQTARSEIYIGFTTALEILRYAPPHPLSPVGRKRTIPPYAPRRAELDCTFAALRAQNPDCFLSSPKHILVGSKVRFKPSAKYKPHMLTKELPRQSLYYLKGVSYVATPELAFVQMATAIPFTALLELGYEICGTYWRNPLNGACQYEIQPLTNAQRLLGYAKRNPHISGADKAQRAAQYIVDNSASPRESKIAILLALPSRYGGYGLPGFKMNHKVDATRSSQAITPRAYFKCDICWPSARIDLEYQSREMHAGETSRISDSRRANALKSMGWHVVEITNDEFDSYAATSIIIDSLRSRLGKRTRTQISDYKLRQIRLRNQLGLPYEGTAHFTAPREEMDHAIASFC